MKGTTIHIHTHIRTHAHKFTRSRGNVCVCVNIEIFDVDFVSFRRTDCENEKKMTNSFSCSFPIFRRDFQGFRFLFSRFPFFSFGGVCLIFCHHFDYIITYICVECARVFLPSFVWALRFDFTADRSVYAFLFLFNTLLCVCTGMSQWMCECVKSLIDGDVLFVCHPVYCDLKKHCSIGFQQRTYFFFLHLFNGGGRNVYVVFVYRCR